MHTGYLDWKMPKNTSLERKSLYDQYVKPCDRLNNKQMRHLKREEKERNKRIAHLQAEIVELESIINEPPLEVNMSSIQRQLAEFFFTLIR
ncbi:3247_t:CDS:2 [Ambispora gerdemannii]|uniref:3247_t:CDS:1 n=1 Tax=Ambispora gerdemannii TaxID=144530 RepID=A0A9N9AI34_9GLOM|nr:3247_t:CDS:2 [Ambispora gerdemannii]